MMSDSGNYGFENLTSRPSNIFRRKQEYLFLFGGIDRTGQPCTTYEVFDVASGIWREF